MGCCTKGSGFKEKRTVKDMNYRVMGQYTLESTWTDQNMVVVYTPGKTNLNILANGKIILSMVMESTYGGMEEVTAVNGSRG